MNSSDSHLNLLELEKLFKCIASWKRLKILTELADHEEGRSYTELTNIIEDHEVKKTKSGRIDFHLEELRKINFVKKEESYALFKNQNREIYRISPSGRIIKSLISSILDQNVIFSPPKDGLIFQDLIYLPDSLDIESLMLLMNFVHEFRKILTSEKDWIFWVVSDQLQNHPHLENLMITFQFLQVIEANNSSNSHELHITAYWGKNELKNSNTLTKNLESNQNQDSFQHININNSLIFIIQELLSRIRDVIYELDISTAKAISDRIFDYIEMTGNQISEMITINR